MVIFGLCYNGENLMLRLFSPLPSANLINAYFMKSSFYKLNPWVKSLLVLLVLSTLGGPSQAQTIRYVPTTIQGCAYTRSN